jgi:hypothetical protein
MIRWSRALESSMDLCSLPSPHRIPQCVAGMAFNFSKIDLSVPPARRNAARHEESQTGSAASTRAGTSRPSFDIPDCSLAR